MGCFSDNLVEADFAPDINGKTETKNYKHVMQKSFNFQQMLQLRVATQWDGGLHEVFLDGTVQDVVDVTAPFHCNVQHATQLILV